MNIVWLDSLESNQMALSRDLIELLHQPARMTVHVGTLAVSLEVLAKEGLQEETIGLPVNLSEEYTIPSDLPYETCIEEQDIYLGPVIAHVVLGYFSGLNEETLSAYLPRYAEYDSVKGLIFICTNNSVHVNQRFIEGYYYNPNGKDSGCTWKRGKFPLPNAVFNRSFLSQQKIEALSREIGDTIFNSYWYNLSKWNLWRHLSKDGLLREHLPYTEKYSDAIQLKYFLGKYNSVYIKPFYQSRGKGILNVSKTGDGFEVVKNNNKRYSFKDEQSIDHFLRETAKSPLIIQQAVPFKREGKLLDFRVFLQKDESRGWSFKGLMGRISKPGSIITTSQGREDIKSGRIALQEFYQLSHEAAGRIENEMVQIVKRAVGIYENKGMHLGDIAADIILDANLHLWLLELQLNYAALNVPIPEIHRQITVTPFRYAKALAGFYRVQSHER